MSDLSIIDANKNLERFNALIEEVTKKYGGFTTTYIEGLKEQSAADKEREKDSTELDIFGIIKMQEGLKKIGTMANDYMAKYRELQKTRKLIDEEGNLTKSGKAPRC